MIEFRRDLHRHPEVGYQEVRTTGLLGERWAAQGLTPQFLPVTGLIVDIPGSDQTPRAIHPRIALRSDIDALRVHDETDPIIRSLNPGVAHACGHDIHMAVVTTAGLIFKSLSDEGLLPEAVRLIYQPAEEVVPGGAHDVLDAGALDGIEQVFCVHCDPGLRAGQIGLRVGPVTSSSDRLRIRLTGRGGHTARPFLTEDMVMALSTVATQLPLLLARRVDPRWGVNLTWGRIESGQAANAIPQSGELEGTLRALTLEAWESTPQIVRGLVDQLVAPFGVTVEVEVHQGVPTCDNSAAAIALLRTGASDLIDPAAVVDTPQSLGGEDFAWYLTKTSGALARLGVRSAITTSMPDLHSGAFDPQESAIEYGALCLVGAALATMDEAAPAAPTSPDGRGA